MVNWDWEVIAERMFKGLFVVLMLAFCIAMWKIVLGLIVMSPVIYGLGWLFDRVARGR